MKNVKRVVKYVKYTPEGMYVRSRRANGTFMSWELNELPDDGNNGRRCDAKVYGTWSYGRPYVVLGSERRRVGNRITYWTWLIDTRTGNVTEPDYTVTRIDRITRVERPEWTNLY